MTGTVKCSINAESGRTRERCVLYSIFGISIVELCPQLEPFTLSVKI